jgi:succinyl-CoA synthetase beta subunit
MNIHEYQAKQVLQRYGVAVPYGKVAFTEDEAVKVAKEIMPNWEKSDSSVWVVKAQIHAGGRGKGGGVKVVKSVDDVRKEASRMLGMTLITPQTGPEGREVKKVYIETGASILKEYYISLVVDRSTGSVAFIASLEGGMEIEEVAAHSPEKIITVHVDPAMGLQPFHLRNLSYGLNLNPNQSKEFSAIAKSLYNAFIDTDASQMEINPLIETTEGKFIALDAKINFDDNALFRHSDILELRDNDEEDPRELEASEFQLSYITMNGDIGCMVNGAGLAMATMDIIKLYGGEPANFLDVGGGATADRVREAFRIILSDPSVKVILVNIFGGIMRCDIIAEGVVSAAKQIGLKAPLVVRLAGTNSEIGKQILRDSGFAIIPADNLADAAEKAVNEVKKLNNK